MVTLSCTELSVTEINRALRELPPGTAVRITEPRGRHNLAVGLRHHLDVTIEGNAGYYIGGLCDGPDITVKGFVGWGVGENLMRGTVRVEGNASECAGASSHGGTVVVAGDVGHMSGFMAQAGTILVGGDAGEALGDSLYEAVVYVGGRVRSLGADARVEDLGDDDLLRVKKLVELSGFDHVDPQNVTRVASAKELYNFDALKRQRY